jgi:FtsZ-interacting cell division protein ZipA
MHTWLYVAIVIGALLVIVLVLIALFWLNRRRKDRAAEFTDEEAEAILREVFEDRLRCLTEPTREHDVVSTRKARQVHGRTASELAAERTTEDRTEAWKWARIQQDLSCDADFMALANHWNAQFPSPN